MDATAGAAPGRTAGTAGSMDILAHIALHSTAKDGPTGATTGAVVGSAGKQRVRAHEQMLSAEHCQQLVAELKHLAGDALGAQVDLEMSVPVPSSLYEAIMSALQVGKASPVVPGALAGESKESGMVVMPAKISSKVVPLHRDRYGGERGALVEGYSAVLYLSDGGDMSFVDASSKHRVCDVSVTPGRLVVWDNASLLHAVDTTEACAPRFMLGADLKRQTQEQEPSVALALVVCVCVCAVTMCVCARARAYVYMYTIHTYIYVQKIYMFKYLNWMCMYERVNM